jgi:hypothetical protein
MRKRGLELQVSYLVILILSIAALAIGLSFAANLFIKADNLRKDLDSRTQLEIDRALDGGQKVALPINRKDIPRNRYDQFGVGVFNTLTETTPFEIEVKFSEFFWKSTTQPASCGNGEAPTSESNPTDPCAKTFLPVSDDSKMLISTGTISGGVLTIPMDSLEPNQKQSRVIGVQVPSYAAGGMYVFDVVVYSKDSTGTRTVYGTKQKLNVKVP